MPSEENHLSGANRSFCFLSYSRGSGASYAKQFAEDLAGDLRELHSFTKDEEPVFFDQTEIHPGSNWTERLETGLKTSKIMVCLLAEHYFQSEYCGKEFQVFLERRDQHKAANALDETPELIVPALWVPEKFLGSEIPHFVSEIQYATKEWGKDYWKEGLLQLIKNEKYSTQYKDFRHQLAMHLLEVSEKHSLQDLVPLPDIKVVQSAFVSRVPNAVVSSDDGGWVQFVYVVATQQEARLFTKQIAGYDARGGPFWKPYLPPVENSIGVITQPVASSEGFVSKVLPTTKPLLDYIDAAQKGDNLLIILLDCWSLELERYRNWINPYDTKICANCEILIPLNGKDPQTSSKKSEIENLLMKTFPQRAVTFGLESVGVRVEGEEDLRKRLAEKIQEVRARITDVKAKSKANTKITPRAFPVVAGPGART